jgi:ABC-type nitrate/sulfonate/bicarbonate transport system substrate-binding protein
VTIPPPLMVDSLRAGQIDGFCVGEPWNSLAVERDIGRIVVTKAQIFPQSIEKVLAVNAGLEADRETLDALLAALGAASRPCREDALWAYAQMLRWGQTLPDAAGERLAARVYRPDLYERSLGGLSAREPEALTAFDGMDWWPGDVASYLHRFVLQTSYERAARSSMTTPGPNAPD